MYLAERLPNGVSTHSRAEAAARGHVAECGYFDVSTHSRAEAAATNAISEKAETLKFQHTAARRRLRAAGRYFQMGAGVSTHSRAEAAACLKTMTGQQKMFQHTAARRRLHNITDTSDGG